MIEITVTSTTGTAIAVDKFTLLPVGEWGGVESYSITVTVMSYYQTEY